MRALVLALGLLVGTAQAANIVELSANKTVFAPGEKAILRAKLTTKPDNENLELDLVGKVENIDHSINKLTEFEYFSTLDLPTVGIYRWRVTVYLQDKRLARDLKATLSELSKNIAEIDEELVDAEDPEQIAELEAAKAKLTNLRTLTEEQLASIRTQVYGPAALNVRVE